MTDRAWIRYDSDDPTPVALPGYLNPVPLVVAPGGVFSVDPDRADELTEGARFTRTEEPAAASPNAGLTKAQLADKLNAGRDAGEEIDPADYTKADLVAMADAYDFTNPPPPGGPTDTGTTEGNDR